LGKIKYHILAHSALRGGENRRGGQGRDGPRESELVERRLERRLIIVHLHLHCSSLCCALFLACCIVRLFDSFFRLARAKCARSTAMFSHEGRRWRESASERSARSALSGTSDAVSAPMSAWSDENAARINWASSSTAIIRSCVMGILSASFWGR